METASCVVLNQNINEGQIGKNSCRPKEDIPRHLSNTLTTRCALHTGISDIGKQIQLTMDMDRSDIAGEEIFVKRLEGEVNIFLALSLKHHSP